MNIRSLTRSDGAVIGAAVLLFIASFLSFFQAEDDNCTGTCSFNTWEPALFPLLPTVTIAGLAAAALLALGHMLPGERKVLGLGLDQWGTALAVFVGWSALWSAFSDLVPEVDTGYGSANDGVELGVGAWLTLIGGLVMAVFAVLGNTVPALKGALLPAPSPRAAAPNPYGPGPQPGGYGYPGGPQPGGYGYPGGPQPGHPQPGHPQPGQPQPGGYGGGGPAPAAAGAPDPNFQPFWFAVPVARPLFPEDGSPNPIAELAPGTWYLAVEQRGQALVAQTQDGRRGVLQDTSGIQRG
ncbi:DUF5336 domain-containing protein [Streptomyces macrosporus]|uniref:Integral membrane protein n=1 Tax=Streptomyces macrosporus TaxID=44032 RepID=A0ABP5X4Z8_9ACTN